MCCHLWGFYVWTFSAHYSPGCPQPAQEDFIPGLCLPCFHQKFVGKNMGDIYRECRPHWTTFRWRLTVELSPKPFPDTACVVASCIGHRVCAKASISLFFAHPCVLSNLESSGLFQCVLFKVIRLFAWLVTVICSCNILLYTDDSYFLPY